MSMWRSNVIENILCRQYEMNGVMAYENKCNVNNVENGQYNQ
jgi:hypothetical protein